MKLNWFFYRILNKLQMSSNFGRTSYSQCGEDLIVRSVFDFLQIPSPIYLDVGAHHPILLSNTYLFYKQGAHGINIEPDPVLFGAFPKQRKRDTNINIGIADQEDELPFYVMSAPALNTFSEAEAQAVVAQGRFNVERVISVKVRPINLVLHEALHSLPLDFFSIDAEGMDFKILSSMDFTRWRPKVICVETITYSEANKGEKITKIADLLQDLGYSVYADTHINTIFVDSFVC